MAKKTLSDMFPLIDDPANIFYSKLKTYFMSLYPTYMQVKALDRVNRLVEIKFPFTSHVWKVRFDLIKLTKHLPSIDDYDKYNAYIRIEFHKSSLITTETTTVGETIPVEEYIKSLHFVKKNEVNLIQSKENVLVEVGISTVYVYLRISEGLEKVGTLIDLKVLDNTQYKENYKSAYKPVIGRKIVFTKTQHPVLTYDIWLWDLYDIDSDNNEILIDSNRDDYDSDLNIINDSCKNSNYSYIWPICYGPSIDHPVRLSFCKTVDNPYPTSDTYTITIKDSDYVGNSFPFDVFMYKGTDAFLESRGLSPDDCRSFFENIKFGTKNEDRTYYKEELALALCYILNINFRFLFTQLGILVGPACESYATIATIDSQQRLVTYPVITTDNDNTKINVPNDLNNGYHISNFNLILNRLSFMYYGDPFSSSNSISAGDNSVPIIQNSTVHTYKSPFTKFRECNLDYLHNLQIYISSQNVYIKSKYHDLSAISVYNLAYTLPSLTREACVRSSLVFQTILYS